MLLRFGCWCGSIGTARMARAVAMAVVVVVKGAAVARARGAQAGRRSRHLQNYGVNVGGSAALGGGMVMCELCDFFSKSEIKINK